MFCDSIEYFNISVQRKQSNSYSMALERHLLLNSSVSIGINVYILEICLRLCYVNWMAKYVNEEHEHHFWFKLIQRSEFLKEFFLFLLCNLNNIWA